MNWSWFLLRGIIAAAILTTVFLSQRFWYRAIWRSTGRWRASWLRIAARTAYVLALLLVIYAIARGFRMGTHGHLKQKDAFLAISAGLWFSSALFAFLAVEIVHGIERLWNWYSKPRLKSSAALESPAAASNSVANSASHHSVGERLADPSRRYFFRAASVLAGAAPFASAMYGFAAERLHYRVRRIEIPIANLPPALDGMKIAQISDIHMSAFMSRGAVRRAVDMTNDLGSDLTVVTGDLITGSHDPIEDCVEEVSRLHSPLGVWGCNGNHEIYADAEQLAEELYAQHGMKLLRQENAVLEFRGAKFNLIGVDYQRERNLNGHRAQMLSNMEPLVRRDVPNILLSHNPNSFNRAAELGIELSLAGHTHGGQIQVEILDHRLTPARFISDYIAGLFERPMFKDSHDILVQAASDVPSGNPAPNASRLYVNRGLGTVGAPVRLGVPPEISLIVLRRA
ncbi:MAG: metallophosphoesterase [Acidobacteria bacterium]|nr:metallophosphoesterase [Acidobacteriota bacterium]